MSDLEDRIVEIVGHDIPPDIRIAVIGEDVEMRDEAVKLCVMNFHAAVLESAPVFRNPERLIRDTCENLADWDMSYVALRDDEIVGTYLLRRDVELGPGIGGFAGEGIEGVGLSVRSDHQGLGIGRVLRAIPEALGADYVIGQQLRSLRNIEHWLKSREIVDENDLNYVTMRRFAVPAPRLVP